MFWSTWLIVISLAVGFVLAPVPSAPAAESRVLEKNGSATLLVDGPMDKDGIVLNLADTLTVTLQVEGPAASDVRAPEKITKSPGWRILAAPPDAVAEPVGERSWTRSYTLEPLFPGALILQIEPVAAHEQQGANWEITWKPLAVRVVTSITTPDIKDLRDPTVIEALPPPPEGRTLGWLEAGVGLVLASMLAASFVYWRRRGRPAADRAERRALRELDRIFSWRLPERGKIEQFHTLLGNVLRRYLEKQLQLPARRRTTPEFLEIARTSGRLSEAEQDFLRDFLKRCDLAKFAAAALSVDECLDLAEKARAFIGQSSPTK